MKSLYCLIATIIYSILIVIYLFYQKDASIAYGIRKVMFYLPTLIMLLFYRYIGNDYYNIRDICFYSVISAIIIIILNFIGIIVNTYNLMYNFFGLIIAMTSIILIFGGKHDLFKNEC